MHIHHFRLSSYHQTINQAIKPGPRPRPHQILQRPWTKYNFNQSQKSLLQQQGFLPKMEKRIRPTDSNRAISPPNQMEITFLGTSAGKPTIHRNPSSLALRMDGQIWIFDCGEATTHQIMRTNLKPSNITKIFITHLHGDHVLGLISFLSHIGDRAEADLTSKNQHPFSDPSNVVEIFGPSGIREYVRSNLRLTQTHSVLKVKVNELLRSSRDQIFTPSLSNPNGPGRLWHSEVLGEDIWSDEDGLWKEIILPDECGVTVRAAPIRHTIDCVGYLLTEVNRREKFDMVKLAPVLKEHANEIKQMGFKVSPAVLSVIEKTRKPICFSTGVTIDPPKLSIRGRRIMILGDTCDPSAMCTLLQYEPKPHPVDLLIHEATGTTLPDDEESEKKEVLTESQMARKMRERGHSTSFMAGQFAHRVGALRLIMNHLGGKFPAPQGSMCPTQSSSDSLFASSGSIQHESGLKDIHAKLWKSFHEVPDSRRSKLLKDLDWLKSVEADALKGWKFARQSSKFANHGSLPDSHPLTPISPEEGIDSDLNSHKSLDISIAYDFLQVKLPRTDHENNKPT